MKPSKVYSRKDDEADLIALGTLLAGMPIKQMAGFFNRPRHNLRKLMISIITEDIQAEANRASAAYYSPLFVGIPLDKVKKQVENLIPL